MHPPKARFIRAPLGLCWALCASCSVQKPAPSADKTAEDSASDADLEAEVPNTAGLVARPLPACDPQGRAALGPFAAPFEPSPPTAAGFQHGDSVTVEDANGDGHLDLLLPDRTHARLLLGDGRGAFNDGSAASLPPAAVRHPEYGEGNFVAALGDLDGDGDLDALIGSVFAAPRLLINDGGGVFTEHPGGLGLASLGYKPRDLPMADLDGDGDLDVFIAHDRSNELPPAPGQPNFLLRNDGGLRFTDTSATLTDRDRLGYTKVAAFVDIDADDDQDLYIVNHMPSVEGDRLLQNDGAGGLRSAEALGADIRTSGMGLAIGDLNEDGLPDLLVSGWGELALLMSDPGGFVDQALAAGLVPVEAERRWVAWGNAFADLDNDADLDVLVAYGEGEDDEAAGANPADEPDGLYINDGAGRFTEASAAAGVDDQGVGRTFVPADLNGDGWLDLVAHGHLEPPRVYLARCGEAPSALLQLVGRPPNTGAVGARITVEAGGHTQTRWVRVMGSGFSSGAPLQAHVGLGAAERIDRLTVRWPDGSEHTWTDLPARHHFTIRQADLP